MNSAEGGLYKYAIKRDYYIVMDYKIEILTAILNQKLAESMLSICEKEITLEQTQLGSAIT